MKQTCILVLGMHRSGTSALTGLLNNLDIALGSKIAGSASDNEKGFFENLNFINYNEKLLKKLNSSWDDVFFDYDEKKDIIDINDKKELQEIVVNEFKQNEILAIKDPRMCYLFPLYADALKELDIEIKVLLPYRNPFEVAKSLHKRNKFTTEKSIALWLNYFLYAENFSRGYQRYFLKFDNLLYKTDETIIEIDKFLELNLHKKYLFNKDKIDAFLEPGLKHNNITKINLANGFEYLIKDFLDNYERDLNLIHIDFFDTLRRKNNELKNFYRIIFQEQLTQEKEQLTQEKINLKHQVQVLHDRVKTIDSSRLLRFYEKLIRLLDNPISIIIRKILRKIIPALIPKYVYKLKNKKIIKKMVNSTDKKVIVVFPIISWGFRWQRPQHLLSGLAKKGYTVLYISKDFQYRKIDKEDKIDNVIQMKKLDTNIYKVYLNSIQSLNIYKDELDTNNVDWFMKQIAYLLDIFKKQELIYFVQFPNWLNLVEKLVNKHRGKIVFDCMDEHSGFSNVDKMIIEHEHELLKISDLVLSSSNKLYNKNINFNKNTVMIKNGTEFDFFAKKQETNELDEYKNKPIIGYYGAIADWFDIDLIEYCALQRPNYNFILIGSTFSCNVEKAKALNNVFFLGEKPYNELPKYLYKFDVCTIPFKIIPLIEATNPVKFYEYISAGKPVVSTPLPELEEFKDICYIASTKEEFLKMLDIAVAEKKQTYYDELIKKRISIAKSNSWKSRVNALDDRLKGN